jgi:hypothetical protein
MHWMAFKAGRALFLMLLDELPIKPPLFDHRINRGGSWLKKARKRELAAATGQHPR